MENRNIYFKYLIAVSITLVLLVLPLVAACSQPSGGKTIELKIANPMPTAHCSTPVLKAWAEKVEQETGGQVQCEVYADASLIGSSETYEGLVNGVVDVAHFAGVHTPAQFPLMLFTTAAMLGVQSADHSNRVLTALVDKFPEMKSEFDKIHLLWLNTCTPGNIHSVTPIRSMKDAEGLQIKCGSGVTELLEAINAVPVSMPMNDVYIALEKGMIDGYTAGNESLQAYRFVEVADYTTEVGLYSGGFATGINLEVWESLPSDVKRVIDGLSDFGMEEMGKGWDATDIEAEEMAKGMGHEFITLSEEALEEMHSKFRLVHDKWAADMDAKGFPGRQMIDETYKLVKKYQ